MPNMIPRGVRFADELFSFIGGTDFEWAQPDWTVSQFTHHWRRENVLPFSDGDIEATITSRQTCDESGETWRLMVAKSRYRAQTMLLQQVVSLIETPFSDGREVAETVTVSPSLRRRLAVNHPHILKSLDEGGTHRLKTTLVQVKRDHDASHAAYHECGRHLDAAATEQKKITITLGGKFPPERLLYETYRQSPYGMWHPVKDGARPLSVTVDYLYETVSFRINRDDPYSLKPPMNRPCSGPERWSTPEVFRILGPRMLGWNLMQVIMAIRDIKWEIPWDYSGFYVLPAREAFRASKLLPSGLNGALQHTATPVNAVPMMNTNRLSRREDPLDARRVRRCWSALTDTEKEGIRALKPEAWVHLSFGLREYRLLAALKYLPTCRSLGGYKEAHRNAEIDVGRREMERFLTPESEREDDIPF